MALFDTLARAAMKFMMITAEVKTIENGALEAGGKEFLKRAKAAMGTYEYGWDPLKPATIARKQHGDTPLVEDGTMRDSGRYEVFGGRVIVEFTDPKMPWHEFGTSRIPPRPVIGGTIAYHGEEIAHIIGVRFGEIIGEALAVGSITAATHYAKNRE